MDRFGLKPKVVKGNVVFQIGQRKKKGYIQTKIWAFTLVVLLGDVG